jgi:hypothetical protein
MTPICTLGLKVEPMVGIVRQRPDLQHQNNGFHWGSQKIRSPCKELFHPVLLAILLAIKMVGLHLLARNRSDGVGELLAILLATCTHQFLSGK